MIPRFRGQCQGGARGLGPKRGWGARPVRDTGDAAPYGCSTGSAQQRADVPKAWPPPTKFQNEIWGVGQVVVPYGWLRRAAAIALGSGAQRSVCGADGRSWGESEQRSSPKGASTPDNPSVSLRLTAPFAQGSLGDGGCGLPRRFAPRNDSPDPLSFRGGPTGRRGNPSFFTMDGGSGRRTKDDGNGTPRSSAPTERRESPINHPSQPARSEASAPADARDGRESTQEPSPKGGPPLRPPRQRLAKRKARR